MYPDPGITGTKAEKRPEFMKMIEDCRAGKIEKIMVKSVSRFARNTVDALNYIRELRDMNVSVQFESENIDTLTPGGEVLLTILAAMAEQESRTMWMAIIYVLVNLITDLSYRYLDPRIRLGGIEQ